MNTSVAASPHPSSSLLCRHNDAKAEEAKNREVVANITTPSTDNVPAASTSTPTTKALLSSLGSSSSPLPTNATAAAPTKQTAKPAGVVRFGTVSVRTYCVTEGALAACSDSPIQLDWEYFTEEVVDVLVEQTTTASVALTTTTTSTTIEDQHHSHRRGGGRRRRSVRRMSLLERQARISIVSGCSIDELRQRELLNRFLYSSSSWGGAVAVHPASSSSSPASLSATPAPAVVVKPPSSPKIQSSAPMKAAKKPLSPRAQQRPIACPRAA
jgi:hypothetical protein